MSTNYQHAAPERDPVQEGIAQDGRPTIPGRLLLTIPEMGMICGIGRTKAYQLVASGEIPSIRVGRVRRVPVAALNEWIEERLESAVW